MNGLPEMGAGSTAGWTSTFQTTAAVWEWRTTQVTTVAANMPVINLPSSATFLYIQQIDSTNLHSIRLQASTSTALSGVGVSLTSLTIPTIIAVKAAATSQFFLWTTASSGAGGGAPAVNVRLGIV